uniref:Uncharacterized protein n=1 Tax=Romanomermis culicivorax TaxID=13658 RepID=A0A915KRA9_ROMCU
ISGLRLGRLCARFSFTSARFETRIGKVTAFSDAISSNIVESIERSFKITANEPTMKMLISLNFSNTIHSLNPQADFGVWSDLKLHKRRHEINMRQKRGKIIFKKDEKEQQKERKEKKEKKFRRNYLPTTFNGMLYGHRIDGDNTYADAALVCHHRGAESPYIVRRIVNFHRRQVTYTVIATY